MPRIKRVYDKPDHPTAEHLAEFGIPTEYATRPFDDALDYLESIARAGARQVYRGKIILLGAGGAGKTSLVNRLLHDSFN